MNPSHVTPITMHVHRRRIFVVSVAIVILTAIVLLGVPVILAPMASQRLTAVLGVPVHVGRITLSAFGPRISAHGITLRLTENEAPVAKLTAIHANLALGRVLRGEFALDSLTLDGPELTIRRTATGDIDLAVLLPTDEPGSPSPARETATLDTTPFDIDALRISSGTIAFHDETATPPIATIVRVDSATADDLHLTLGGHARVDLLVSSRIDDDAFTLELAYEARGDNSDLAVRLRTTGASLASLLVRAQVAWEHVAGLIDAEVTYERTVKDNELRTHRVSVNATVTDLALADITADAATFRATTATISDLTVDLAAQHVALGTITAEDFWALAYRDATGLHVPFVHPAPENDGAESAWHIEIGEVTLGAGTLLLRDLPPRAPDLPVAVRSGRITTEQDAVRFVFDTAVGDGTIGIDGRAQAETTNVTLTLDGLSIPAVASHLRLPIAFSSGRLGGTLDVVFPAGQPHFRGRLVATDVKSAPSEAHPEEVFAWATLEIELADSTIDPTNIHATSATLTWPYMMVHRHSDGVYPFAGISTTAEIPTTPTAPPAAPDGPLFVLDRGTIAHGRVEFYDTVLDPAYGTALVDLAGTLETLRVPPLTVQRFDLAASIDELSPVEAAGTIGGERMDATLAINRMRLVPLSPYIAPSINYDVTRGTASFDTKIRRNGTSVTVDNDIDLKRLKLRAQGTDLFKGELGVALPVALSLMKDSRGHIALDLPVTFDLDTQEYELGPSITAAIQQALLGTLLSPVRILGAVLLGDDGEVFELKPVPFAAGSVALSDKGQTRVGRLAELLERHADLEIMLLPKESRADVEAVAAAEGLAASAVDLSALATSRAETIRRTLHESYGIDLKRVRAREPRADLGKVSLPRVDVELRGQ